MLAENELLVLQLPFDFVAVDGQAIAPEDVVISPRVGVDYGKEWAKVPLRFSVRGNPHVSKPNPEGREATPASPPRKKAPKKKPVVVAAEAEAESKVEAELVASTTSSRAASKKRQPTRTQPPYVARCFCFGVQLHPTLIIVACCVQAKENQELCSCRWCSGTGGLLRFCVCWRFGVVEDSIAFLFVCKPNQAVVCFNHPRSLWRGAICNSEDGNEQRGKREERLGSNCFLFDYSSKWG